jgi:hypothetical protein
MNRDFFDPSPEEQKVVLIGAATLREAEKLIESWKHQTRGALRISTRSSRNRRGYPRARARRDTSTQMVTKNPEMPTTHRGRIEAVPRSRYVRSVPPHYG